MLEQKQSVDHNQLLDASPSRQAANRAANFSQQSLTKYAQDYGAVLC